MTRFAIDAATLLLIASSGTPVDPQHQLVAPNGIRSQALQLILDQVRSGALPEDEALDLHDRITQTKLRLLGDRVSRRTAWLLARQHDWEVAEAECVALALLQADALLTIDPGLSSRAEGVVRTATLDELGSG